MKINSQLLTFLVAIFLFGCGGSTGQSTSVSEVAVVDPDVDNKDALLSSLYLQIADNIPQPTQQLLIDRFRSFPGVVVTTLLQDFSLDELAAGSLLVIIGETPISAASKTAFRLLLQKGFTIQAVQIAQS